MSKKIRWYLSENCDDDYYIDWLSTVTKRITRRNKLMTIFDNIKLRSISKKIENKYYSDIEELTYLLSDYARYKAVEIDQGRYDNLHITFDDIDDDVKVLKSIEIYLKESM